MHVVKSTALFFGLIVVCASIAGFILISPRTVVATGLVTGTVTYGPTNPLGGFCSTPAKRVPIMFIDSKKTIHAVTTNDTGVYTISLPAGSYTIVTGSQHTVPLYPSSQKERNTGLYDVTVEASKTITFDGCYDTGIR